jgi:hypothetical protein
MRLGIQLAESFDFGGVSPGRRKRLGCEWGHDRLMQEQVLLSMAGAQFQGTGGRAVERARDGAVALADHHPVGLHTLQNRGRFDAVIPCRHSD